MALTTWFHPSRCGDFRLSKVDDDTCTLTVIDPTPSELVRLGKMLIKARKKGWVANPAIGVAPEGKTVLELGASVAEVGIAIAGRNSPKGEKRGLITAVRSMDGKFEIAFNAEDELLLTSDTKPDGEPKLPARQPAAAVTTRRPTLCCPHPIPGPDRRASQVLRTFCTENQWDQWMDDGWLIARGNLTGHRYQICHRHHPLARRRKKIAYDLEDGHIVHAYDWAVPPAEEVLALKLVFEHAEDWVRNPSGYFGPGPHFRNPFMAANHQYADGVADTALLSTLGLYCKVGLAFARSSRSPQA